MHPSERPIGAGVLDEVYARLHRHGPEFGGDEEGNNGLTNHAPMAAEVIVRRGLDLDVHRWLDRYVRRLDELPTPHDPITEATWPAALGDGRRIGDWTAYFSRQLSERPWREVLVEWWPRLLPGIAAGATHGVIRVAHAVRTLLASDGRGHDSPAVAELARALAFWAARSRVLRGVSAPAGRLPAAAALAAVPRLADQSGLLAQRLARLDQLPSWSAALAALAPAAGPAEVPAQLADLVAAATRGYLDYGAASPVLLVHTATAPNAVLHTLPALPRTLWEPSLTAAWAAAAAIVATYAPSTPAPRPRHRAPAGPGAAAEVLARAAHHGDEHVLKFTDTAVEVFDRTGDPDALVGALHAGQLIEPPR
jgi:hypothetical protein